MRHVRRTVGRARDVNTHLQDHFLRRAMLQRRWENAACRDVDTVLKQTTTAITSLVHNAGIFPPRKLTPAERPGFAFLDPVRHDKLKLLLSQIAMTLAHYVRGSVESLRGDLRSLAQVELHLVPKEMQDILDHHVKKHGLMEAAADDCHWITKNGHRICISDGHAEHGHVEIDPTLAPIAGRIQRVVGRLNQKYGPLVTAVKSSGLTGDVLAHKSKDTIYLRSDKALDTEFWRQHEKEWAGLRIDPSLEGVLTHEYGHVLFTRALNTDPERYNQEIAPLAADTAVATSAYGQEHSVENEAEAFAAIEAGRHAWGLETEMTGQAMARARQMVSAAMAILKGQTQQEALDDPTADDFDPDLYFTSGRKALIPPAPTPLPKILRGSPNSFLTELLGTPLGGAFYQTSFADLGASLVSGIRNILLGGLMSGEGVAPVARRLQGLLGGARYKSERIVRSEFGRVANQAALTSFAQNSDVIQAVQWISTLDDATCLQCGELDARTWESFAAAPVPVADTHPNCRCRLIPVVKGAEDLGLPEGTRASFNGQVPASLDYETWFDQQDDAFQREVLGPTRYRLYASGQADLSDFATASGVRRVRDVLADLAEANVGECHWITKHGRPICITGSHLHPTPPPSGPIQATLPGLRDWTPPTPEDLARQEWLDAQRAADLDAMHALWATLDGTEVEVPGPETWAALTEAQQEQVQNAWEDAHVEDYIDQAKEDWINDTGAADVTQAMNDDTDLQRRVVEKALTKALGPERAAALLDTEDVAANLRSLAGGSLSIRSVAGNDAATQEEARVMYLEAGRLWEDEYNERISDLEVPEDVTQGAYEAASEAFAGLDDESKDELAKAMFGGAQRVDLTAPDRWRVTLDPHASAEARDEYLATGRIANALVAARADQLWRARYPEESTPDFQNLASGFWRDWKKDSFHEGTLDMHQALVQELSANTRGQEYATAERKGIETLTPSHADRVYTRALWDTTQFLLTKAGVTEMDLYRSIILPAEVAHREPTLPITPAAASGSGSAVDLRIPPGGYVKYPSLALQQNPAQSFTFSDQVANTWDGVGSSPPGGQRVVLRAKVPSTAIWSLPLYGKNIQHEQEAVVLGTPWKKWDAWMGFAPPPAVLALEALVEAGPMQQDGTPARPEQFVIDLANPALTGGQHWLWHGRFVDTQQEAGTDCRWITKHGRRICIAPGHAHTDPGATQALTGHLPAAARFLTDQGWLHVSASPTEEGQHQSIVYREPQSGDRMTVFANGDWVHVFADGTATEGHRLAGLKLHLFARDFLGPTLRDPSAQLEAADAEACHWITKNGRRICITGGHTHAAPVRFAASLGIERKNMPQIRAKDMGEFLAWVSEQGVTITRETVPASSLRPAQAHFNPEQVAQMQRENMTKPLVVSRDHYILDGTHRWVRFTQDDPTQAVTVLRIDRPATEAIDLMKRFPKAEVQDITDIGAPRGRALAPALAEAADADCRWITKNGRPICIRQGHGEHERIGTVASLPKRTSVPVTGLVQISKGSESKVYDGRVKAGRPVIVYRGVGTLKEIDDAVAAGAWESQGDWVTQWEGRTQVATGPLDLALTAQYPFLVQVDIQGLPVRAVHFTTGPNRVNVKSGTVSGLDHAMGLGVTAPIPLDRIKNIWSVERPSLKLTSVKSLFPTLALQEAGEDCHWITYQGRRICITGGHAHAGASSTVVTTTEEAALSPKDRAKFEKGLAAYGLTREGMRAEILAKISNADGTVNVQLLAEARHWYPDAHAFATDLMGKAPITLEQAVGVIAALSPQNPWEYKTQYGLAGNKVDAASVVRYFADHTEDHQTPAELAAGVKALYDPNGHNADRHLGPGMLSPTSSVEKAFSILRDGSAANLAEQLGTLKTASFYNNILAPGQTRAVTIDGHMAKAIAYAALAQGRAMPKDGPGPKGERLGSVTSMMDAKVWGSIGHVLVADQVRQVADTLHESPDTIQAAYWLAVQPNNPFKGTYEAWRPGAFGWRRDQTVSEADQDPPKLLALRPAMPWGDGLPLEPEAIEARLGLRTLGEAGDACHWITYRGRRICIGDAAHQRHGDIEPKIYMRPDDLEPVDSWGGEQKWKDKKHGDLLSAPISKADLPPTLYHTTVAAPAIEKAGLLLAQSDGGGMGGGAGRPGVSFTTSQADAELMLKELGREIDLAHRAPDMSGAITRGLLETWAREDEQRMGLPAGTFQRAVDYAMGNYEANVKPVTHVFDMEKYGGYADDVLRPQPELDKGLRSLGHDAHSAYMQARETDAIKALGADYQAFRVEDRYAPVKNPLIFGDAEAFKALDKQHLGIVTVPTAAIPDGALIRKGSDDFLHEVRVHADVPLHVQEPA